jgi:hypothetical protein
VFPFRNFGAREKSANCFETLRPITGGMSRTFHFTAFRGLEAMTAGWIGFFQMPFRQTVKTKKEMVKRLV